MAPKQSRCLPPPAGQPPSKAARVEARLNPGKLTVNSCKDKKVPVLKPAETEEFLTTKGSLGAVPTLENPGDEPVAVRDSGSVSSSSDSSSDFELVQKRRKNLHSRARHRRRKYVDFLIAGRGKSELTLLERKAIGAASEKMYQKEMQAFLDYAQCRGLDVSKAETVDKLMVQYMNLCYLGGHQAFVGDRLIASWLHHHPQYSKAGVKRIPRALRCLKGWRRLCPGRSRVPYPLAIWCGVACLMMEAGFPKMAVFVMLALSTYSRPSELLRLRRFSLIPPATGVTGSWSLLLSPEELQQASKTGDYDVSVLLDSPYTNCWVTNVLKSLKKGASSARLWDFDYSQYLAVFKRCAKKMDIPLEPYHSRHSGPSIDRSRKYRSQLEVQKRGQWKSNKSVVRYEKAARLARTWEQIPTKTKEYSQACEAAFDDIMTGRKKCPSSNRLGETRKAAM